MRFEPTRFFSLPRPSESFCRTLPTCQDFGSPTYVGLLGYAISVLNYGNGGRGSEDPRPLSVCLTPLARQREGPLLLIWKPPSIEIFRPLSHFSFSMSSGLAP